MQSQHLGETEMCWQIGETCLEHVLGELVITSNTLLALVPGECNLCMWMLCISLALAPYGKCPCQGCNMQVGLSWRMVPRSLDGCLRSM